MTVKFELGKKYTNEWKENIYLCVGFSSTGKAVLENAGDYFFTPNMDLIWTEYKEPKRGKVWVNVYKEDSFSYENRRVADSCAGRARIACIEVPWVEGQGLE